MTKRKSRYELEMEIFDLELANRNMRATLLEAGATEYHAGFGIWAAPLRLRPEDIEPKARREALQLVIDALELKEYSNVDRFEADLRVALKVRTERADQARHEKTEERVSALRKSPYGSTNRLASGGLVSNTAAVSTALNATYVAPVKATTPVISAEGRKLLADLNEHLADRAERIRKAAETLTPDQVPPVELAESIKPVKKIDLINHGKKAAQDKKDS